LKHFFKRLDAIDIFFKPDTYLTYEPQTGYYTSNYTFVLFEWIGFLFWKISYNYVFVLVTVLTLWHVSRDKDSVMWWSQCHVSILNVKNYVFMLVTMLTLWHVSARVFIYLFIFHFFIIKNNCCMSIWRCAMWQRQCNVMVAVPRINIECEKSCLFVRNNVNFVTHVSTWFYLFIFHFLLLKIIVACQYDVMSCDRDNSVMVGSATYQYWMWTFSM